MMLRPYALATLMALGLLATHAQAEFQTWTLTATTYNVEEGFNAPAFAQRGTTITIDYVFDMDARPSSFGDTSFDFYAPEKITVNGVTSLVDGYIWTGGESLNAINVQTVGGREDKLSFISLNNPNTRDASNVAQALQNFSQAVATQYTDVRLDFGPKSVWADPTSFVRAVPEPATVASFLLGLSALAVVRRRRR